MHLRVGTRGSKLALWQANHVKGLLEAQGMTVELVLYTTTGDLEQSQPLHTIGGQGLFTKVLDDALLNDEIDIAVHSAKDLPSVLPDGLALVAISKREDPRDVLLSRGEALDLDNLSSPISVGTSSLRRMALLRHYLPHVQLVPMRGNVDTRVQKMIDGACDAIVLAYAGVKRMGLTHLVTRKLNVATFTPAVGQGALGITMSEGHLSWDKVRATLNDLDAEQAVTAERAFLRMLEGGCHSAVFSLGTVVGGTLTLLGGVAAEDGSVLLRQQLDGPSADATAIGIRLADLLLDQGARTILHGKKS